MLHTYLYTGGVPGKSEGKGITHVTVQDGVESIDDEAFEYWDNLVSVHIASSVTRIGWNAFLRCTSLSSINLPTSLQYIDDYAFVGCRSLSSITIPPSITDIQLGTFQDCSSLSQVIIPPSVIEIGEYAFWGCSSLISIKLPNGVQIIDEGAFGECISLESIQIPPSTSTESIGDNAFLHCSSLKIIYIPSSAIDHSDYIFDECDQNLIILTDFDGYEYEGLPSITLDNIHQCIQDLPVLPNDDIPINEQLDTLHHVLHERFPDVADKAQESGFNLLHLLVYFPGDIYEPLSTLLTKCPQATIDVDWKGKTPIHHAIKSTKHNMDVNNYNLLLRYSLDTVVHRAIAAGMHGDDLHELVKAKTNALTLEDDESRLLPFMMVAEENNYTTSEHEGDLLSLTASYELLSMDPSVLQDFIVL